MNVADLLDPRAWSTAFGLADSPLFGSGEERAGAGHRVMLDGGHGTFALSLDADEVDPSVAASWAWSSDIPHHVAVSPEKVTVTRWDQPREAREFSVKSVSDRFDTFYRFLVQDRVQTGKSVVDHLVEHFRKVRTAVSHAGEHDKLALQVFLALLADLLPPSSRALDLADAVGAEAAQIYLQMKERELAPLLAEVGRRRSSRADLELYSTLAVRHAGGLIFQEAHFDLMRAPARDLFGFLSESPVKPVTRGGAHFTPPALARSVVEQTIQQLGDLRARRRLVLADPACGSGAFLHEALRGLERAGFQGELVVVGRDISEQAVAMARFVLERAKSDWEPAGGLTIDVAAADSLIPGVLPEADMIVMNPPFVAVGGLNAVQQDHIDRILGPLKKGRPDLSMAFVLHAISRLAPGGSLGCLFPASLLELQAASLWRREIAEQAELRFLALLGDHGLFAYALVQVGAAVLTRAGVRGNDPVLTLWTADEREVTGEALRALRIISTKGPTAREERDAWRIAWADRKTVEDAPSWRLRTPEANRLIHDVREATGATVEDLFNVRQCILTGSNGAFIIDDNELRALPQREQRYFKPAAMNKSIDRGQFIPNRFVFYPYRDGVPLIHGEEELLRSLPRFSMKLNAMREVLQAREGLEQHWWELTRRRPEINEPTPRVVSKYFGGPGAFVLDEVGEIAVVQGYAWIPAERLRLGYNHVPQGRLSPWAIAGYAALLNSRIFSRLVADFAPRVAGGQFNLSRRYVRDIPLPDLVQLFLDERLAEEVVKLDGLGRRVDTADAAWVQETDELASRVFNVAIDQWKE